MDKFIAMITPGQVEQIENAHHKIEPTLTAAMTKTILKALVDQDKSITDLAKEIKRSRVYTSNVVNCRFVNPPMPTVKLIAKALHMSLEDLISNGNDHKRAA